MKVRILPNDEENPEITKRNISFSINDGNNSISGANVVIGEVSGTTGSAGGCTLQNISDGEHSVTITAEGYVTKTETIVVSESDTIFTISLDAE
jgi:hypothetical protein